jgi:hypothetical protein
VNGHDRPVNGHDHAAADKSAAGKDFAARSRPDEPDDLLDSDTEDPLSTRP